MTKWHLRIPDVRMVVEADSLDAARKLAEGLLAVCAGDIAYTEAAEIVYTGFAEPMECCQVCGCTDDMACDGGCSWVVPGLCDTLDRAHAQARQHLSPAVGAPARRGRR